MMTAGSISVGMTRLELATTRPPDAYATNCATSRNMALMLKVMQNYYFMNKSEDFCEFIRRFKNDKEFRSLIDSLHLMMQESFESDRANPLSVMLDVIEKQ